MVNLSCDSDLVSLHFYRVTPVAAGMIESGIVTEIEVFSQGLRKNFGDWNLQQRSFSLSVSSGAIVSKVLDVPKMKKREIYNFFKSDVEEHPLMLKSHEKATTSEDDEDFDEDQSPIALTYTLISQNEDSGLSRFFLMSSSIDLFNSYLKAFKLLDRNLGSFTSDTFGVLSFLMLMKPLPDETSFVLYVSDDCSEFIIVNGLDVLFYHKAQFSAHELLKRPLVMVDVIMRVQMMLIAYQDKYPDDNNIDKLILVPCSYDIAEIFNENLDELNEKVNKPIQILNPLKYINTDVMDVDRDMLSKDIYQLIPAIGVAVASKRNYAILDFLKNKVYSGPIFSKRDFLFMGIVASIALASMTVLYLLLGYYTSRLDSNLTATRQKLAKAEQVNKVVESGQASKTKADLAKLQKLLEIKMSRMEIIDTLSELIPDDLWLDKIELKTGEENVVLTFSGKGNSKTGLELFIRNLKEEYDKVDLDMVKLTDKGTEFVLKCTKGRDDK